MPSRVFAGHLDQNTKKLFRARIRPDLSRRVLRRPLRGSETTAALIVTNVARPIPVAGLLLVFSQVVLGQLRDDTRAKRCPQSPCARPCMAARQTDHLSYQERHERARQ